jgi:hypothetical protein
MARRFTAAAARVSCVVIGAWIACPPAPAAEATPNAPPQTGPAAAATEGLTGQEQKVKELLDYLEADYARKAASKYWVSRAMGVVNLARIPRPSAGEKLLDTVEKEKHDVVRLLAWQGALGRLRDAEAAYFDRFLRDTYVMAERGMFRGPMRVAVLDVISAAPPNDRTVRIWQSLFAETSAWESHDIPTLDALGACLKAWRSHLLYAALIGLLQNRDHGVRAEYVLGRAGSAVPSALSMLPPSINDPFAENRRHPSSQELWQAVRARHEAWLMAARGEWSAAKPEGVPWRRLGPLYVPAPVPLAEVNPTDPFWRQDLELANADLAQFEAAFVVDATASMGPVLEWMRRDVARMAAAFQTVCKEPVAIGITFYRDANAGAAPLRHVPLTRKLADLERELKEIQAEGGGDVPEAVLDGLAAALTRNRWSQRKVAGSKVVILVGDAPPHANTVPQCVALAKRAADVGVRLYAAKVTIRGPNAAAPNDLSDFDKIAGAGGGSTVAVEFTRATPYPFINVLGQEVDYKTKERPEIQLVVAPPPGEGRSGELILARVLADTISPKYRDRVEPLAYTLLAYCDPKGSPERRTGWPAITQPYPRSNTKIKWQNR